MPSLPAELAAPALVDGRVVAKVMLDLTVYLAGPSEEELAFLIDLYERLCPPRRLTRYTIAELETWEPVAQPHLTASGRRASEAGVRRPHLEPVRNRIREGRAFEVQFWDGLAIDDPEGSWSFSCRRIHLRTSGLHAFVRILLPATEDPEILRTAAREIADRVGLHSGHGGWVFVYDPWKKYAAFDLIYAQARRFWGVDVEDLNETLPLMHEGIKGVNWITLLGDDFAAQLDGGAEALRGLPGVRVEPARHGVILVAGPQPEAGDQNRPDARLAPYYAAAEALRPVYLTHHPDFSGARWVENGNTLGWIRRFIEPEQWR